jgi:hypothetical protein
MRMRDVYASLRELVPAHLNDRAGVRQGWTDRSDPIWSRAERWVRVEAITGTEVMISAGQGDVTDVQRPQGLAAGLDQIAEEVAHLLEAGPAPA